MAFKQRKFKIRNQMFGYGKKGKVGLVSQRKIMVNGVKQKPGERARGGSQLKKTITKRKK